MGKVRKPQLYARMLGATPKLMPNVSQRIHLPAESLVVFVMRAIRPSSPSNGIAKRIASAA